MALTYYPIDNYANRRNLSTVSHEIDPRVALQSFTDQYPTQKDAALALRVSPAYLSDMLAGRRDVSRRVLAQLGLRRTVVAQ